MSHQETRKHRIDMILASIQRANKQSLGVDKKKLIANCCLEFNASDRKVKEYLDQLITAGYLEYKEDGLLWRLK